jgi:drug/metabolite transporter (DMT)-like permease
VVFSLIGFTLYSFLLFWGIQLTDSVFASMLIGFLPITIAALGSRGTRLATSFWFGLFLCLGGILLSQWNPQEFSSAPSLSGVAVLLVCLSFWTFYAVLNAKFLKSKPELSAGDWSCALGLMSFVLVLPLFFWGLRTQPEKIFDSQYLLVSMSLGFGSSFLANLLWNRASQRLPAAWLGPLISSETFFGVVFSHVVSGQSWSMSTRVALGLMILGVVVALRPSPAKSAQ